MLTALGVFTGGWRSKQPQRGNEARQSWGAETQRRVWEPVANSWVTAERLESGSEGGVSQHLHSPLLARMVMVMKLFIPRRDLRGEESPVLSLSLPTACGSWPMAPSWASLHPQSTPPLDAQVPVALALWLAPAGRSEHLLPAGTSGSNGPQQCRAGRHREPPSLPPRARLPRDRELPVSQGWTWSHIRTSPFHLHVSHVTPPGGWLLYLEPRDMSPWVLAATLLPKCCVTINRSLTLSGPQVRMRTDGSQGPGSAENAISQP